MSKIIAKAHLDEAVTEKVCAAALVRGREKADAAAAKVEYCGASKSLIVYFEDGSAVILPVAKYSEFSGLTQAELAGVKLGFAGSALCLESQNVDVSIAGMIAASPSLLAMSVQVAASRNGRRTSPVKAVAARRNGRLGGRPPGARNIEDS